MERIRIEGKTIRRIPCGFVLDMADSVESFCKQEVMADGGYHLEF
jgi:hypothetical protein